MSIVTIDNHLIHYEVVGRGHPVIFIHGWLGSWRYWWPSMQELSRSNRAFAFDLWGYGNSSKVAERYNLPAYVKMLGDLMERLGISQPVTLVGHALGASIGLSFASQHPELVARVAAVSLPMEGRQIHERLTNSDASTFLNRHLGRAIFPEVALEAPKSDPLALNSLAVHLRQIAPSVDLEQCPCPVLLIAGSNDPVVQPLDNEFDQLVVDNGNAHHVTLDGCSHFPMLEEKAKFNRLLLDFIHGDYDALTEIAPKELWRRRLR